MISLIELGAVVLSIQKALFCISFSCNKVTDKVDTLKITLDVPDEAEKSHIGL